MYLSIQKQISEGVHQGSMASSAVQNTNYALFSCVQNTFKLLELLNFVVLRNHAALSPVPRTPPEEHVFFLISDVSVSISVLLLINGAHLI